jgi:hypothetical protein
MKLKFYIVSFIILFAFANTQAQEIIYTNNKDEVTLPVQENNSTDYTANSDRNTSKVDYKINVGTSFSSSKFGNAVSMYTAPEIRYKLAPKLSISTGFLVTNTTLSGYYASEKEKKNNFTNAYIFTGIDYYATERLRISGEILYGMNQSPYSFSGNNSNSPDYYLSFSAEYQITKSLSIGVQVTKHNMGYNNPFNRNSFNNYYNPYNPFSRF